MTLPRLTFVLGGAASGKSGFAESLIYKGDCTPLYVATAQVFDEEMAKKVEIHREMRGANWQTVEEPLNIDAALKRASAGQPILIDCATLWLTNVILGEHDIVAYRAKLFQALSTAAGPVVIVSNEVGYGIVPENALSRRFRNEQGRLNQEIAERADTVITVIAGLPLVVKGEMP